MGVVSARLISICVQRVENVHYWYYMLELGFYWSLLLCVSVDVKRKVGVEYLTQSPICITQSLVASYLKGNMTFTHAYTKRTLYGQKYVKLYEPV